MPGIKPIKMYEWDIEFNELDKKFGPMARPRPSDDIPTLNDGPDAMDLNTANAVMVQAQRWLEFTVNQITPLRAKAGILKSCIDRMELLFKYKYKGKIELCSLEEFETFQEASRVLMRLGAELVMIEGIKSELGHVKDAASRTITAQKQ